jgi:hypothetical protein
MVTAIARVLTTFALFRLGQPLPGAILAGLGQTLVLSTLVSWQWWWLLARLGDAAITMTLVPIATAEGYSRVMMSTVAVLASLPQWLILRRYGLRSILWFAVPVFTAVATVLVYRVGELDPPAYILDAADYLKFLPTIALIGTISGLLEGIAVAWILAPEFDPAAAVVRAAARQHASIASESDLSHVNRVRTFLIVLIALVVPIFMPKMFTETWGFPDAEIVLDALATVAPWGVSIALLRPGLYHAGLAIAATASIVTAIGMIPAMVLVTILKDYVFGSGGYVWVAYAGALGATVTLVIVAVLAIRALRALPESERLGWAWPTALGGCVGYAVIFAAMLIANEQW